MPRLSFALLSPDGRGLILTDDREKRLQVWDLAGEGPRERFSLDFKGQGHKRPCSWSPDGRLLAVRGGGEVAVWDAVEGRKLLAWQQPGLFHASFAPDGRHLLVGEPRGRLFLLRLRPYDDSAKVLAECDEALRKDPRDVEALLRRAAAHAHRQDHDRAVADCTEAIRIDARCARAWYNRGRLHALKQDYGRARADLEEALRIDPTLAAP